MKIIIAIATFLTSTNLYASLINYSYLSESATYITEIISPESPIEVQEAQQKKAMEQKNKAINEAMETINSKCISGKQWAIPTTAVDVVKISEDLSETGGFITRVVTIEAVCKI